VRPVAGDPGWVEQVRRTRRAGGAAPGRAGAFAALVTEADFIAAQDATAPRGPAGSVARRYLLAGLLACGRCGRRLESAWSNGKPAYQCRHGYTTDARPDPERPKNTYVREDRVLPHLAAIAILLGRDLEPSSGTAQIAAPDETAVLIDQLRAAGTTLTYHADTRTLRTSDSGIAAVTVGQDRLHQDNSTGRGAGS
jgi:site-specific DNA recombinase